MRILPLSPVSDLQMKHHLLQSLQIYCISTHFNIINSRTVTLTYILILIHTVMMLFKQIKQHRIYIIYSEQKNALFVVSFKWISHISHIFKGKIKCRGIKMTRFSFQELRESLVIQETRATLARLGPLAKRVSHVLFLSHSNLKQIKHTFDLSGRFCVIKMISFLSFKI